MTAAAGAGPFLSAFALNVPEAEPCVGDLRARFDPSCALGVPAHITILYPFMEPSKIDDAVLGQAREVLSAFRPFTFRLQRIERFPGVLYLAPEPALPMKAMTYGLAARFPSFPPYGGQHAGVVPHLTVAQAADAGLDAAQRELRSRLPAGGIAARCAEIVLMENTSGLWKPMHRFPLAELGAPPSHRSPLHHALVRRLADDFADRPMRLPAGGEVLAVFPAMHPEVGDVSILANGDELVLSLGRFTHLHFACHDKPLPPDAGAARIVAEVAEFLRELFADRIEFYGTRRSGWRPRTGRKRGALSRLFFGRTTYVWSGPLPEENP